MSLKVIGSGFGRTGTMSTKMALEQLGLAPCHHMLEVMQRPEQPPFWEAFVAGEVTDWKRVFAGFEAQVDFPGAAVWEQTEKTFPEALVLHTERPEEDWWASYSMTIGKFFTVAQSLPLPPAVKETFATMDTLLIQGVFGGRTDKASCIAAYRRNNEKVRDTIAKDRLLVFTPSDGWTPLCDFLGLPVPAGTFPRSNARDEFWAHFGGEPALT